MYAILTENDISQWNDISGVKYHFPKRYRDYLLPGTKVIFYKGTLKNAEFKDKRLSSLPHYFAYGVIARVEKDPQSNKNDFYAFFSEYKKFQRAVLAKEGGRFIEEIPATRKKNYWRDGVRQINEKIFFAIMNKSDLDITHGEVGSESKCEYSEGDTLSI